jgi:hypothetical protein
MIFHASIAAKSPVHVANIIANLWGGTAMPFPSFPNAFITFAGDDRNSAIEVYPLGHELVPADDEADATGFWNEAASGKTSTHLAIASPLSEAEIKSLAAREGWTAKTLSRSGIYRVVEFWLENTVMLEVLTQDMQREYLDGMTPDKWREYLATAA